MSNYYSFTDALKLIVHTISPSQPKNFMHDRHWDDECSFENRKLRSPNRQYLALFFCYSVLSFFAIQSKQTMLIRCDLAR